MGRVVDGNHHLGPGRVGEKGAVHRRDLLVAAAGQKDLLGRQDLGQLVGDGEVEIRLREPELVRALEPGVPAAVGRVHDDGPGEEVVGEVSAQLVRQLVGAEGLGRVGVKGLEYRAVHDAVVLEPGVLLEVAHGAGGAGVEEAVDGAGVEAEVVEHLLQLDHVRAPEGRLAQVEQPCAGPVAGLDDVAPGGGPNDPVGQQAQSLLEGPHGGLGPLPEDAVYPPGTEVEAEGLQAGLEVHDLPPPIALPQRAHVLASP